MGRYSEQYTEEQRTAVGSAMLDLDALSGKPLTARQATERLNAGRLGCPAPSRPMPIQSAYDYKRREARRRAGHELSPAARQALEDPATAGTALLQRAVSVHERLLARLEAQIASGKGQPDLRLYAAVIRNQVQVQALLRPTKQTAPQSTSAKQQATKTEQPSTDQPSHITDLLAAHKGTAPRALVPTPAPTMPPAQQDRAEQDGHGSDSLPRTHVGSQVEAHA